MVQTYEQEAVDQKSGRYKNNVSLIRVTQITMDSLKRVTINFTSKILLYSRNLRTHSSS